MEGHFARSSTVGDAEMKTVGRAGGGHCTAAKPEPLDGENVKKFLVPRKKARVASQPGMGHSDYDLLIEKRIETMESIPDRCGTCQDIFLDSLRPQGLVLIKFHHAAAAFRGK